ncbi:MAG TPA: LuxR C-terminal-related transcriptional regulator [Salinimicrobium sp.]|nr:LuxR C-terminal-related transcriptional regulator [Salinimicrobium sp.]
MPEVRLSKQENTIKNLIVEGKTNKEIANELFISPSTHITNIYSKLQISGRKELCESEDGRQKAGISEFI